MTTLGNGHFLPPTIAHRAVEHTEVDIIIPSWWINYHFGKMIYDVLVYVIIIIGGRRGREEVVVVRCECDFDVV